MSDSPTYVFSELSHPPWPRNHECLFTEWMPYRKTELYRVCVHPKCHNWEKAPTPK